MIQVDELFIEDDLRIISSDISMLAPEGVHEQLFAQMMGWA